MSESPETTPLNDTPEERLRRALAEHPNATYVRVEAIDLRAALDAARAPVPAAEPERAPDGMYGWARAVPAAEPRLGPNGPHIPYCVCGDCVPAADDRELLREALSILDVMIDRQTLTGATRVREILRAGVSPSTGDAERLHEAIRAVYYEDKHPDLGGGLTTDPADARLAAAILRRMG
jgi:hypothetical protein